MAQKNAPVIARNDFTVSRAQLATAITEELEEYFFDGVLPTLGQYAVQRIVGGIIGRVEDGPLAAKK
jgi:hypothetical protein